jgi:hypothetical protein
MRRLFFALALMSAPLCAEELDPNTPAGLARIVEAGDGVMALALGEHTVTLPTDPWIAFLEARRGDLLLVGLSQGGNACGAFYAWVHATPGDIRVSDAFGTCNELVSVSHDAETVAVRLKGVEPGRGDVTFLYDGRQVTRRQEALAPSGQGDQGADYWVGRYAFDFLHAAELQVPLRDIMGADALLALQGAIRMTSPMRIEGDWVIGEGYVKYQPITDNGFVAMNRIDGRLVAGLRRDGAAPELFGDIRGPLTGTMKDWIGR